jgi:hypothetical protein
MFSSSSSFNNAVRLCAKQLEATFAATTSMGNGWHQLANETNDYIRQSFEMSRTLAEELSGAKNFEEAARLHADFAKSASREFLMQITKVENFCLELTKEIFKLTAALVIGVSSRNASGVPAE